MGARQFIQHPLPNTLLVPTAEMIVYGLPGWKILGQHPPLTAAFGEVENRIHNLSPVVFGRSATPASHLEIVGNAAPLLFAQIRQVGQFKSHAMLRVLDSLAVLFSRQLLNLFIWVWSLKDYLKTSFEANGLEGRSVEEEANRCTALTYVADIANRAKHGELQKSRSGDFAELTDVGFSIPQECIKLLTVAGTDITLDTKDQQKICIHATVVTRSGIRRDALTILEEAMECWETKVLTQIAS